MRRVRSAADLAVACPLCHAQPGRPCVSTGGHGPMPGVIHRERRRVVHNHDPGHICYQNPCPYPPPHRGGGNG